MTGVSLAEISYSHHSSRLVLSGKVHRGLLRPKYFCASSPMDHAVTEAIWKLRPARQNQVATGSYAEHAQLTPRYPAGLPIRRVRPNRWSRRAFHTLARQFTRYCRCSDVEHLLATRRNWCPFSSPAPRMACRALPTKPSWHVQGERAWLPAT